MTVSKLIRVLSSHSDGLAFVRELQEALDEAGCDLRSVVASTPFAPKGTDSRRPDWQVTAEELLTKYPHVLLGSRERDFLQFMRTTKYAPTQKREKWLNDINSRRKAAA